MKFVRECQGVMASGFHVEGDSSRVLILGMYPPWGFSHHKA
jgi:hypothetical protein